VSEQTIDEYREKGIIKKVPKISSVRFNPQHIADIEETKLDRFSPIERKKLEREIEALKQKLAAYEEVRAMVLNASTKMINL
jgi:3-methyladenine DNA glycosylase Tag